MHDDIAKQIAEIVEYVADLENQIIYWTQIVAQQEKDLQYNEARIADLRETIETLRYEKWSCQYQLEILWHTKR